jgi:hypothetical protein
MAEFMRVTIHNWEGTAYLGRQPEKSESSESSEKSEISDGQSIPLRCIVRIVWHQGM